MTEWAVSTLAELVTFQKGRKVETSAHSKSGYLPYLGASGIEGGHDGYAKIQNAVIARHTDILMLWDGERSGLVGYRREGVVSSTVSKLTPNEKVDPIFLFFALQSVFEWIQLHRTGTGVPHVPKDLGRILSVSYPKALFAQRKIASILSTIDTAIEKTETLIAKYQQIKTGLMHDLFSRGVLPNGQLRPPREKAPELYQETAIGWIPKDWSVRPLQELCQEDITYGIVQAGPHIEGGVPYIRTGDMSGDQIDIGQLLCTSKLIANSFKRSTIRTNEIVMAIRATVGNVILVPAELNGANLTQGTARISPKRNQSSQYLLWALKDTTFRTSLLAEVKGTTFAEITLSALRKLPIKVPQSIQEQIHIGDRLHSCETMIKRESGYLLNLHHQKRGLMQDLLTGKVPVKVDVPEKAHA